MTKCPRSLLQLVACHEGLLDLTQAFFAHYWSVSRSAFRGTLFSQWSHSRPQSSSLLRMQMSCVLESRITTAENVIWVETSTISKSPKWLQIGLRSGQMTKDNTATSLRKPTFCEVAHLITWALAKRRLSNDDVHYPDLGSASDWFKENSLAAQPIRSTTKTSVVHVISMEFLRSLLRRRFARAQVATSRNVGCFLRLQGDGIS